MPNRTFKIWAYSPSHSRLIIRGLPSENDHFNEDHIFTGVSRLEIPQVIVELAVHEATPGEVASTPIPSGALRWYALRGLVGGVQVTVGYVLALEYRSEMNELAHFRTTLDEMLPEAQDALDLERQVLVALASAGLNISAAPGGGIDFLVHDVQGRQIGVEVKWFAGRPPPRAVRSIVMSSVPSLPSSAAGLAFILGGVADASSRSAFTYELEQALTTALGGRSHLVVNVEDTPVSLIAERLARL